MNSTNWIGWRLLEVVWDYGDLIYSSHITDINQHNKNKVTVSSTGIYF